MLQSNEIKLYFVEVCIIQTCKFVILCENIRQKRTQNYRFKNPKTVVLKRSFLPNIFSRVTKFACLIKARINIKVEGEAKELAHIYQNCNETVQKFL